MERLLAEQEFHDRQAEQRAATFQQRPEELCFDDATYLDHESWIRPAFRHLGAVSDKRVLDFGCGHGMAAVVLARQGGHVTAFDLSPRYVGEAQDRARANGVAVDLVQADGTRLPFADGTFHAIWGHAILHHLDVEKAARELFRVLQPGGVAVFCEPWGDNILLRWARAGLPYPGKHRTADEQPLRRRHLQILQQVFPTVKVRGFQLLSMIRRVTGRGRIVAALEQCDAVLLSQIPALQRFCRYVVLTLGR
jgi:ubiquinone/menaquinone biosynthesis C-methylase UbiE